MRFSNMSVYELWYSVCRYDQQGHLLFEHEILKFPSHDNRYINARALCN